VLLNKITIVTIIISVNRHAQAGKWCFAVQDNVEYLSRQDPLLRKIVNCFESSYNNCVQ